ncbi:MAG: aldo/keto reductase [[Lactobacillus] timonensis]|jgi:diketogulonate reductase-like aldo/keto reductase|uniref:aldo/keto reductase n=1 Tax=[Lactobacillus] timonensis TaxID=1970790 RepID=UPI000C843EFC|nr:aldo/keto reductase [[Lactobacillus] timonensis]MCI1287112.1 aldo/keto reductase [[Lactobacillus] timonensis]MCI1925776.1 aldo/keto reductase [[Lactobacillus] timonensis]MCI1957137.1 aldo/keto reductase [[Lactobacillus] timonensis]MCI1970178.1 aldo/keto reductase [[Lactobacillus] timonensis]MCI2006401.1 aldo/keto reductase [[Lactobacillus] timonensis]
MEKQIVTLSNGVKMPKVGLGVWKSTNDEARQMVEDALSNGYRLIDTAKQYGNEIGVGEGLAQGLKKNGLKRQDVFLTTKIFNGDQGDYNRVRMAFNEQLERLQTDYVDLLLLHWPVYNKYNESWRALQAIYEEGQARAIGVCNFDVEHMTKLMDKAITAPMVNQIEFNPRIHQPETVAFCQNHQIQLEAWSPLGNGKLLDNPVIKKIAEKYKKTVAQVELRWELQQGLVVIPKTTHVARMKENMDIFDFELNADEMEAIAELDEEKHAIWYDKFKWSGNPDGIDDYIATPGNY